MKTYHGGTEITEEGTLAGFAGRSWFSVTSVSPWWICTSLRVLVIQALLLSPAWAVNPGERLQDAALEARAREISQELRCLVCQNQSIDDSNADLAHDLRVIVRERLVAGDSNDEVLGFVTRRYGDFVLLKPPVKPVTWALWFGPPALLVLAGLTIFLMRRRRAETAPAPLSPDERRRLDALLREGRG